MSAAHPERLSYYSFVSFSDPDGNGWLLQEVTKRLPGRVAGDTAYTSAQDRAQAMARDATAHGKYEAQTGKADPIAELIGVPHDQRERSERLSWGHSLSKTNPHP